MYSSDHSTAVVDALYARAGQLELRWSNAGLALESRDRMIDAVLRYIDRQPRRDVSPKEAENLLGSFWTRNARRDAVRANEKPPVVSLTDFEVSAPPFECDTSEDLIQRCRGVLARAGFRLEVAEAFIQRALYDDPDEVISAVRKSCGFKLSADTLRQWKFRHFDRVAEVLRANARAIGLADELRCHKCGRLSALDG